MTITKKSFEELSSTGRKVAIMRYVKDCKCVDSDRLEGDKIIVVDKEDEWSDDGWGLDSSFQDRQDIHSQDELKDAFDNVDNTAFCDECFGLGKVLYPYIFKKIRYTGKTKANKEADFITNDMDFYMQAGNILFFLPSELKQLNENDYICTLVHDENNAPVEPYVIDGIYKIRNITENFDNNFLYLAAACSKVTFSDLQGVEVIEYKTKVCD